MGQVTIGSKIRVAANHDGRDLGICLHQGLMHELEGLSAKWAPNLSWNGTVWKTYVLVGLGQRV